MYQQADTAERLEAKRGGDGNFGLDMNGLEPPEPKSTAAREPVKLVKHTKLAAWINHKVKWHDDAMRTRYDSWRENRNIRNSTTDPEVAEDIEERTTQTPAHREHYRPNIVRPQIEQHISTVMGAGYRMRCRAATHEEQDGDKARIADKLLRYQAQFDNPDRLRERLLNSAVDCDALGFLFIHQDPRKGELKGYVQEGGRPVPVFEGAARIEAIPAYQCGWDPAASWDGNDGTDNCRWWWRRLKQSREQLAGHVEPEQLRMIAEKRGESFDTASQQSLHSIDDPSTPQGEANTESVEHRPFTVIDFYMKRNDEWPMGLHVLMVDGVIVEATPAQHHKIDPRGDLDLPISIYNHAPIEGKMCGVSITGLLKPLQEASDANESSRLERDKAAAYLTFVGEGIGSADALKNMTSEHAKIIATTTPNSKISVVDIPPSRPADFTIADRALAYAENLTHIDAMSRGMEGDTKTATESKIRSDASHLSVSRIVIRLNLAHEAAVKKMLILIAAYYTFPRLLRAAGDGAESDVQMFRGADIAGYTDVEIYSDTAIPSGPHGRLSYLRAVAETLTVMDPEARLMTSKQLMKVLAFDSETFGDDNARIKAMARSDAHKILTHGPAAERRISVFEDHEAYIEVFREILSSPEFQRAPLTHQLALEEQIMLRIENVQRAQLIESGQLLQDPGPAAPPVPGQPAPGQPPAGAQGPAPNSPQPRTAPDESAQRPAA